MNPIKILVVEDEFTIALDLKTSLEKLDYHVVGIASDYDDAMHQVEDSNPDIVLMDIQISGEKDGIFTAISIYEKYQTPIIFLTGNGDDATFKKALNTNPFGFLLKPFNIKELSFAIQVALKKSKEKKSSITQQKVANTLFIKNKSQLTSIKINDILWVQAMDNYSLIFTVKGKEIANMFLKDLKGKIPEDKFLRIHRSYIVALDKIEKIDHNFAIINDQKIPISKAYKSELLNRLDIL